jgi:uncharacterized protein YecT (DUF1311 family)
MSSRILSLFAVALFSMPAAGQMFEGDYRECSELSTLGITECVAEKTRQWDARLNRAYQSLRQRTESEQQKALLAAQRLWIRYRDANCRFYSSGPGTISRIEGAECLRSMTRERTCELEAARNQERDPSAGCE